MVTSYLGSLVYSINKNNSDNKQVCRSLCYHRPNRSWNACHFVLSRMLCAYLLAICKWSHVLFVQHSSTSKINEGVEKNEWSLC